VFTGVDTPALLWLYLTSGGALLAFAFWRYAARTPADLVAELATAPNTSVRNRLHAVDARQSAHDGGRVSTR
jgi:hypothetical protein